MEPSEIAKGYDALAEWWGNRHRDSDYGMKQLERAILFSLKDGIALDVGCGSSGRFMHELHRAGFTVEGMDVSEKMLELAKLEVPEAEYFQGDIGRCALKKEYAFISAWDSSFHLPLGLQEPALKTMCDALTPAGILIYTFGGESEASSLTGGFEGQKFAYSTLGVAKNLELLDQYGCDCIHLEFDQGTNEKHVYIIARKR